MTGTEISSEQALASINQAVLAVASKLSLEDTLQQIADSACQLTGARYAAIGEFNPSGEIETFITSGMEAEVVSGIDHPPVGQGLLGAIMALKQPLRVPVITDDPRSVGFPDNHPMMTSFLGVPVMSGSSVLGNLYLTDKASADEFSLQDQQLIVTLSHHAAVAIENAHLYEASQARARELKDRNRELGAVNTLARIMTEFVNLNELLDRTLVEVLSLTGMDAGEIFLLSDATNDLRLMAHQGADPESFHTFEIFALGQGVPGQVAQTGETYVTTNLRSEGSYLRQEIVDLGYNSFVCIPIRTKGGVLGTLGLASRAIRPLSAQDINLLETIGHQIGVAVENARLYEEIERLAIIEERSRIGMDLHDGVIQSIYAVGLTLETTRLLLRNDPEQAMSLLDTAVEGLNDAIRDIRNFILDLRPRKYEGDARQGLSRLVREFQANTMIEVEVDAPESATQDLPAPVSRALVLTAQEALANVARHAKADNVWLKLEREDGLVRLEVRDNGQGFDLEQRSKSVGHGLANMESRANELGGRFEVESQPSHGTRICLEFKADPD